ncbi:MAG: helix-turn-helix transcriptional regulator [Oligoflexia bacterium]|nr:helix-turn-helix transcriptional regulator [Oligoflexia bacterium]
MISIKAAAELAGVSPSTISDWTTGSAPNDFDAVARLARALNVSFEYLCLGTSENRSPNSIPLEELFEEVPTELDGIFKIKIVKLQRRSN